jgi:hypothetical protein
LQKKFENHFLTWMHTGERGGGEGNMGMGIGHRIPPRKFSKNVAKMLAFYTCNVELAPTTMLNL